MSTAPAAPKPNRMPWIVVGALGCLIVCLLLAVVAAGGYFLLSPSAVTTVVGRSTTTPVAFGFVSPVASVTSAPSATSGKTPTAAQPTSGPAQPTAAATQTTARATATPTHGATATAVAGEIIGAQAPVQPTQPANIPPSVPTVGVAPTQPPAPTKAPATQAPPTQAPPTAAPAQPSGKVAFSVKMGDRPEDQYVWIMNADGSGAAKILDRASEPTFSPDGSKIAYYHWTDGIYVANADGTNPQKILGDSNTGFIEWSHDGRWIAFSSQPGGKGNVVISAIPPDGSAIKDPNARRMIVVGESPSWSPDDTMIVFHTCRGSTCGIFKSSSTGGDGIPIVGDDGGLPAWSPDGNQFVYQKDMDGQKQLFVINVDGSGKRQLTSGTAMHVDADWSADGSFIYYRSPEGGTWGIWRMNADGSNPIKLLDNVVPVTWPYERVAVTR